MLCDFDYRDRKGKLAEPAWFKCKNCRRRIRVECVPIYRACKMPGLGDGVAWLIGLVWRRKKKTPGKKCKIKCDERQQWLNRFGAAIVRGFKRVF